MNFNSLSSEKNCEKKSNQWLHLSVSPYTRTLVRFKSVYPGPGLASTCTDIILSQGSVFP